MAQTVRKSPETGEVRRNRHEENWLVDREGKDSFPASDPPSHNNGTIGSPQRRETPASDAKDFEKAAKRK
ncbi:MAG TPA: hypothetical protein VG891_06650 [Rhizomicrobium sp.]|nr:hypothetical protein [Rhizomicrobium sp.]